MAYPYGDELWRNRTTQFNWGVDNSWAPLREVSNYAGGSDDKGKQRMSPDAGAIDREAGRPDAARFTPVVAAEIHRARHAATRIDGARLTYSHVHAIFPHSAKKRPPFLLQIVTFGQVAWRWADLAAGRFRGWRLR